MKSGPDPVEVNQIRRKVTAGASLDDLKKEFANIEPGAIEAWWKSLLAPKAKAPKKAKSPDPLE